MPETAKPTAIDKIFNLLFVILTNEIARVKFPKWPFVPIV